MDVPGSRDPEPVIGGTRPSQRRSWLTAFVLSLTALAVSFVALIVIVFAALTSDGNGALPGGGPTPVSSGADSSPSAPASPTVPHPPPTTTSTPGASATNPTTGVTVVSCGDILAPLDKQHRLPADCAPAGLVALPGSASWGGQQLMRSEAANALLEMFSAAARGGSTLYALSSYRSYQDQVGTYDYWVRTIGEQQADRTSARPGHSEHQLGTTTDLTSASAGYTLEGFAGTPEARWVADNSWRYGFIVSYPSGKEDITGYSYEPWHVRYVTKEVARMAHDSGLTLHEFLLRR